MNQTTHQQYADLQAFRQTIFSAVSKRRDAVINLCDALLERPKPLNIAELSLSPHCTRRWPSLYDAVEEAVFDTKSLERGFIASSYQDYKQRRSAEAEIPWFVAAGDGTVLRRSSCRVVDGLRYAHTLTHEVKGRGIVAGHQYQLLRYVSEPHTSWTMPLMSDRLGADDTLQSLAAAQLDRFTKALPSGVVGVSVFDGAFGCATFLQRTKDQKTAVIARLRHDRVCYRLPEPDQYKGRGCKALYGTKFDCEDAQTWHQPDDRLDFEHERYGAVDLQRWDRLLVHPPKNDAAHKHKRQKPLEVSLIRSVIHQGTPRERLLWLVLQFNALPEGQRNQTKALWLSWDARSSIEPSIKVSKQELSWTMPQTFTAAAADRWTHVVDIAHWHLFLARDEAVLTCFGWQKKDAPITPRRVRQSMATILLQVGSPAKPVRLRGKSPGWAKGTTRQKRERHSVIYIGTSRAA